MDRSHGESGAANETESFKAMSTAFDENPDYGWNGEGPVCSAGNLISLKSMVVTVRKPG